MNNAPDAPARPWEVVLLGGASGVGKSSVSYRLARRFGVGLAEVDDFHILLEQLTTPEQLPAIHVWRAHPAPDQLSADEISVQLQDVSQALAPGLAAVIANHLQAATPIVLEGDFIDPELAARASFLSEANAGRVRAVFLHEPDERQLAANYLAREPEAGPQPRRARVSWLHSQWLAREAERLALPVVLARPWDTVLERVVAALS
jgi:2-phosphoglycerate kinase